MKNYTDYQRQQIAEEEYNSRLKFGQPVTIDEGKKPSAMLQKLKRPVQVSKPMS